MIIGITGGSGVGKSTVSKEFEIKGFFVIDADVVAHKVMDKGSECLKEVIDFFGSEYLNSDSTLNRKKLGTLVFNNKEMLGKLNEITHKYIIKEIEFCAQNKENVIIDAAVLFESGLFEMCEKTVFVSCPYDIRIQRIVARDNVKSDYAKSRIDAQQKDEYYKEKCDFEIINDGENNIEEKVEEILTWLKA